MKRVLNTAKRGILVKYKIFCVDKKEQSPWLSTLFSIFDDRYVILISLRGIHKKDKYSHVEYKYCIL